MSYSSHRPRRVGLSRHDLNSSRPPLLSQVGRDKREQQNSFDKMASNRAATRDARLKDGAIDAPSVEISSDEDELAGPSLGFGAVRKNIMGDPIKPTTFTNKKPANRAKSPQLSPRDAREQAQLAMFSSKYVHPVPKSAPSSQPEGRTRRSTRGKRNQPPASSQDSITEPDELDPKTKRAMDEKEARAQVGLHKTKPEVPDSSAPRSTGGSANGSQGTKKSSPLKREHLDVNGSKEVGLGNAFPWLDSSLSQKSRNGKVKKSYGQKSSQPKSSQGTLSNKAVKVGMNDSPNRAKFKKPASDLSSASPKTKSKKVDEEDVRPAPPKFMMPDAIEDTPETKPVFNTLSQPSSVMNTPSQTAQYKENEPPEATSPIARKGPVFRMPSDDIFASSDKENLSKPTSQETPLRPRPVFQTLDTLDSSLDIDPTQLPPSAQQYVDDLLETPAERTLSLSETPDTTAPRCPMCKKPVDAEFYKKNTTYQMNIREQSRFCALHKKHDAKQLCVEKGYPNIDWDEFEKRLSKYQSRIKSLLTLNAKSHFRTVLQETVDKGEQRTLKQAMNLGTLHNPGYYGPRGQRAMSEWVIAKFNANLRELAPRDRLVASRGVAGYVDAVVVPELATLLVMDDLKMNEEEARGVLKESSEVGELLNEEVGDVVERNWESEESEVEWGVEVGESDFEDDE